MENKALPVTGGNQLVASKKGRKRVSRRKMVKRPKRRRARAPESAAGLQDADVPVSCVSPPHMVECTFSDENIKKEFLEDVLPFCGVFYSESGTRLEAETSSSRLQSSGLPGTECKFTAVESRSVSSCSDERSKCAALELRPGCATLEVKSEFAVSRSRTPSPVENVSAPTVSSRPGSFLLLRPVSAAFLSDYERDSRAPQTSLLPAVDVSNTTPYSPPASLIKKGLDKFRAIVSSSWIPIADNSGFHLLLVSLGSPKAIQREIFMSYEGVETIFVHCESLLFAQDLLNSVLPPSVPFTEEYFDKFCERGLAISKKFLQYDVCVGANHEERKEVWYSVPNTYVDRNPYQEKRYVETCRSLSCSKLVELGKRKRCNSCSLVMQSLQKRKIDLSNKANQNTANAYLTHKQALEKLKQQRDELRKKDKRISYLSQKISEMQGDLGVCRKKGNVEEGSNGIQITDKPLPKRKRSSD